MIINEEEVEKSAEEYSIKEFGEPLDWIDTNLTEKQFDHNIQQAFIAGEKLAEDKIQEYVGDVITENQGLKLYKDNEAKRFKELAVEFLDWYQKNTTTLSGAIKYWDIDLEDWVFKSNKEIFETYKEKNEKN